jgi:ABC-type branched-subunit amino acid transport system substrate-binding protein/energy-coupling factor transporter ATP-binding protein EcfA2
MGSLIRSLRCGWGLALLFAGLVGSPTGMAQSQSPPAQPAQQQSAPQQPAARNFRIVVIPRAGPRGERQSAAVQKAVQRFANGLGWTIETIQFTDALARSAALQATGEQRYDLSIELISPKFGVAFGRPGPPAIFPLASANELTAADASAFPLGISILPRDRFAMNIDIGARLQILRNYLRSRLIRRVAVIYENNDFGQAAERGFRQNEETERGTPYIAATFESPSGAETQDRKVRLASAVAEVLAFRPEAIGIFASAEGIRQVRDQIATNGVAAAALLAITDPRDGDEASGTPNQEKPTNDLAFVSVVQPPPADTAGTKECEVSPNDGEGPALAYDTIQFVASVRKQEASAANDFRSSLAAAMRDSAQFRGACTGMTLRDLHNVAQPVMYESTAGEVRPAALQLSAPDALLYRARLIQRVYGYMPILILVLFAVWAGLASAIERARHSRTRVATSILLRFTILSGAYLFLAQNGVIWWDSILSAVGIAIGLEAVAMAKLFETKSGVSVGVGSLYRTLLMRLDQWLAVRRYKDPNAARNVLASSNPLATLDQSARFMLAELPNPEEHRLLERTLEQQLAEQTTVDGKRKVIAQLLLEKTRWTALADQGLVPPWARDTNRISDPEIAIRAGVDFCELRLITADDLDRYIRRQLVGARASLLPSYELMLAESQQEASERQRLSARMRFIITMFGAEFRPEDLAEAVAAMKAAGPAPVPPAKSETLPAAAPLKLVRAELENIRCFISRTLDFSNDGQPRPWTMLLGDNACGKTTILRCIAMALCDQSSATALMQDLPGELLRQGTDKGTIYLELRAPDQPDQKIWSRITLTRRSPATIELQQSTSGWFPRDRLFVCGYGALRSGFGSNSPIGYVTADAMRTLFKPEASLQNPELALRRIKDAGEDLDRVCRELETVLLLEENSTKFGPSGVSISGPWGQFVPVGAIGDGYLATLAWLADLFGWAFFFRTGFASGDVSGIVIIDEIEKHLHPRWQRKIVRALHRQLPNVQFIASTHSPLCAGGLADLEAGQGSMYRFWMTSGAAEGEPLDPFCGWTYDQIMTSSAFQLESVRDVSTQEIVEGLQKAHDEGDEDKATQMSQALQARSIVAFTDERDRQLRERLVRTLEALERTGRSPQP